jgi:ribosome-associated protein YbcJ (S4-like RNA binding protein)
LSDPAIRGEHVDDFTAAGESQGSATSDDQQGIGIAGVLDLIDFLVVVFWSIEDDRASDEGVWIVGFRKVLFSERGADDAGFDQSSIEEVAALRVETEAGRNPRDAKVMLGQEIVTRFHSQSAADAALAAFEARFRDGAVPENMPEVTVAGAPVGVLKLLREAGLVASGAEAQRNVEQGGVRVDGDRVEDKGLLVEAGTYVIQVGKRKFARVTVA